MLCQANSVSSAVCPNRGFRHDIFGPRARSRLVEERGRLGWRHTVVSKSWPEQGQAAHALTSALRIGRQGEVRDRTTVAWDFRIAGLSLLAAIIVLRNSDEFGHTLRKRKARFRQAASMRQGTDHPPMQWGPKVAMRSERVSRRVLSLATPIDIDHYGA